MSKSTNQPKPEFYIFSEDGLRWTFSTPEEAAENGVKLLRSDVTQKVGFGANGSGKEWLDRIEELHQAIAKLLF